jgi:hypothetical protein
VTTIATMVTALSTTKASHASRAHAVRAARCGLQAALTVGRHGRVVEAADFYDLDGEGLEPGEQPMQSCLILERAVYHRLDRLERGGEPVEVK